MSKKIAITPPRIKSATYRLVVQCLNELRHHVPLHIGVETLISWTLFSVFLTIKPTRCTNFSNLFLEWKSTCFGQFLCPSSGVFHCTHNNGICCTGLLTACEEDQGDPALLLASCQQNCMTYTIVVCTVKNSWWWTKELSETCRVSFQE